MNYEKIVTLYDTAGHAADARRGLEAAGFPSTEISTLTSAGLGVSGDKLSEPGIWHRLFGRDIEQHEATVYGRVVGSGGAVLTVRVPESDVPKALSILNAHRAVDVQHRAVQEGLIASTAAPAASMAASAQPTYATAQPSSGEEVLRLAEEQLDIGKRLVREGTTRIRRFVVETPVEKQITLHEEHVRVIRRVISDPESLRNIDWADKTIEVNETVEEPVVTKSAHLTEEVVIQKEGTDQVKTVRDKVRRQQVEVERLAGSENITKK
ncbi:MAG TPA: YsnF/AvaK domain-containing protein [Bryobacteraceae bacterium]|nr:YsnF/AvaK domain-containing protein [Bryobacteraceae bacterium]